MSTLTDFLKGLTGGSSTTVTSSSSTTVEVNPEITSINVIDTAPLEGLLGEITQAAASNEDQIAEAAAARDSLFTDIRLWLAVGAFGLALMRRKQAA